jgi:hypothetical protein
MRVPLWLRSMFGAGIATAIIVTPCLLYRWDYTHAKRLREVVPGLVYRSGQMTVDGFIEAMNTFHFRTIINLQEDYPDPDIALGYFTTRTVKESVLCRQLGARFLFIPPDTLPRTQVPHRHPAAIDHFLRVMDDPESYPALLHCRAGLHRTGIMVAVYRMEYQGWSQHQAIQELKANGFGEWPCSSSNEYIAQYILTFRPRLDAHSMSGQLSAKPK